MDAAWRAYAAGLAATLLVAVAGQALLRSLPAGSGDPAAVREVGYAFTGLCMLGALLLARRRTRIQQGLDGTPPMERLRRLRREYLRLVPACSAGALCGVLYWGLGGRSVERYARTYLALGPAAFLALAPRPRSRPAPTLPRA